MSERIRSKSGYLSKLDLVSKRSWKKRFFVLEGSILHYFENQQSAKPKGSILLLAATDVKVTGKEGIYEYCFNVITPFSELHAAAASQAECDEWVAEIRRVVQGTADLPRAYLTKKGGIFEGGNKRRYFIMHADQITWHNDDQHIKSILGRMPLDADTILNINEDVFLMTFNHKKEKLVLLLL
jgi:hypothetical protein